MCREVYGTGMFDVYLYVSRTVQVSKVMHVFCSYRIRQTRHLHFAFTYNDISIACQYTHHETHNTLFLTFHRPFANLPIH